MVNFHDPNVITRESDEVDKLWCFVNGIFIWEFLITLDYEWSVIRGHRPYRWTIWIYSLTRFASLTTVVLNMVSIFDTSLIDCQVAVGLQFAFAYLGLAAASLLIVLRIIAIWDREKIVVVFATGVWGINIAFLIQGIARFRGSWEVNGPLKGCVFDLDSITLSTIVAIVTDTILLLIMLLGLYRLRRRSHGSLMGLGRLLWNQGVFWFLLAVAAGLTPTVFIILSLNQSLDLAFQVPWVAAMTIAATRMYRSLSDFLSADVSPNIPPTIGSNAIGPNGESPTPIVLTGIQVSVHATHDSEQRSAPPENCFGSSIGEKPHEKLQEVIVGIVSDYDIEDSVGKMSHLTSTAE